MMRAQWISIGLVLVGLVSTAWGQEPPPIRQRMRTWITANLNAPPDIQANMATQADALLGKGSDICIYSDRLNTRSGQPVAAFTYAEELFALPLTIPQARMLGVYPGSMHLNEYSDPSQAKRMRPSVFELTSIRIDNPQGITSKTPVKGQFTARKVRDAQYGRIVVRVGHRSGVRSGRSLKFYDALPPNGTFDFSLDPPSGADNAPFFGPVIVMVDLLVTGLEDAGSVASNTLVTIIDVPPDHEAYAQSSIAIFNKIIEILASVKDRASAQAAVTEYTRVVVQNKALTDALDRLPPAPPELERRTAEKYNALAEEMAQKLQAQMTRLEQADYAGPQFIDSLDNSVKAALGGQ